MLLVVGLGNPGGEYAMSRHNIGFMAVDAIAGHQSLGPFRSKFHGVIAEGWLAARKMALLKPMTYMNESGRSVAAAAGFFDIPASDVIVFHDEIDLAAGKIRVKRGGGHAGHNGLRDIHAHLGPDYRRVRLGVGHPGHKDLVTGHVLDRFAKADRDWLEPLLAAVAGEFPLLAEGDYLSFMSRVAQAAPAPGEEEADEAEGNGREDGL
jgi:PTH1 family peptidyl-tRNA hydrolase